MRDFLSLALPLPVAAAMTRVAPLSDFNIYGKKRWLRPLKPEVGMPVNMKKLLLGGLVAGVIINIIDFISNAYILGARMKAESDAFKPGMSDAMMQTGAMVSYIIMDLVLGVALIWTYAAIRPRYGAGPRTAAYAALLFWLLALIFTAGYRQMGIMSSGLWWTFAFVGLVNFLIATWAGAALYSEEPARV
jgi:hypothetical protein